MKYRVHVTDAAVADTETIRSHIAEDSPEAAERVLLMLEKAMESLADFPKRYPLALESKKETREVRHMIVGSYRVLFIIINDVVHVIRLRHAAQRPFKPGELN